jgi:hypothetical protein
MELESIVGGREELFANLTMQVRHWRGIRLVAKRKISWILPVTQQLFLAKSVYRG